MTSSPEGPDDWRARDDMRTLMSAAAIRRDPKRLKAAQAAAKKKLKEQQDETAQMRALAQGRSNK